MLWTRIEHTITLQQGYIHPSNNPIYMEGGGEKEEDRAMGNISKIKGGARSHEHQDQEEEEDETFWINSKIE